MDTLKSAKINDKDDSSSENSSNASKKSPTLRLLTNGNYMFLLLVVFMNGLARAIMTHFLEPIQRTSFKAPQWATGFSTVSGVFFEIVVFFYAKPLLQKFGVRYMLLFAQVAMVLRISCYAFLPRNFELVQFAPIAYELFKGLNFGFMHAAGVQLALKLAPPELKTTAQSLFTGVFSGLSACFAGIFGYIIQNSHKDDIISPEMAIQRSDLMLQITAYMSMVAFVVFFIKYIAIDEWLKKNK
ncbi:hypothetical protein ROZALSC1DRAFT_26549 [Rozella allomycis CSF55]|uniref:Major facilitator superfamily associated domain-containing protein n=1 Tax=Rozella allomycis (strain CSF55) TaxID=988480 RepID=A0A075B363_ROZAC|nr:hypothetical protein O9G_005760 [Rozella allomycis CSF55]RKP22076.1 hypothetical protein ROZALSC1DRAFT_26549 [Rozella allomycis CSF55]|eukprot:EPZ37028.1 hypothetical protein O9G_005760 [Rozella allomycis CSF55]